MATYQAFGLTIQSTLPFPELDPAFGDMLDVVIRQAPLRRPKRASTGPCLQAGMEETHLWWADVGSVAIREGREIIVDPLPEVDERVVRLAVLGSALGVLLHQRGMLALHASAVEIGETGILFVGESGQGKSTTAAALVAEGAVLLADDVAAIDQQSGTKPQVLPALSRLKLDVEPALQFGFPSEMLVEFHECDPRRAYPIYRSVPPLPHPINHIFVLREGPEVMVRPCQPQEAFIELIRHSYALRLLGSAGATPTHFEQCAALVHTVPISWLERPRDLAVLPQVVQIAELAAQHTQTLLTSHVC